MNHQDNQRIAELERQVKVLRNIVAKLSDEVLNIAKNQKNITIQLVDLDKYIKQPEVH